MKRNIKKMQEIAEAIKEQDITPSLAAAFHRNGQMLAEVHKLPSSIEKYMAAVNLTDRMIKIVVIEFERQKYYDEKSGKVHKNDIEVSKVQMNELDIYNSLEQNEMKELNEIN